ARVVELTGLADDNRAGADDQDVINIVALWHGFLSYLSWSELLIAWGVVGHQGDELVKQWVRIVRARSGLRVVLHGVSQSIRQSNTFDGAVIQAGVGNLRWTEVGLKFFAWVIGGHSQCEAVVLRGDINLAADVVFHRHVDAAVAEFHLEGIQSECASQQLVAEADAEKWHLC